MTLETVTDLRAFERIIIKTALFQLQFPNPSLMQRLFMNAYPSIVQRVDRIDKYLVSEADALYDHVEPKKKRSFSTSEEIEKYIVEVKKQIPSAFG